MKNKVSAMYNEYYVVKDTGR